MVTNIVTNTGDQKQYFAGCLQGEIIVIIVLTNHLKVHFLLTEPDGDVQHYTLAVSLELYIGPAGD